MNHAPTPDGRGQDRPHDAEPFFPSEGSFNSVVPLSEIGRAHAPLPPFDAANVGRPAEAAWAREERRGARDARKEDDETTLVPARARRPRRSWTVTAAVIVLSVAAGLASGTYLIWSSQRAPEAQAPPAVAAEAPSLPPAPVAEPETANTKVEETANTKVERVNEPAEAEKPREVAKAEKSDEVERAPKREPPPRAPDAPRAERPARAVAEPKETAPAPKPAARTRSAAPARARLTTSEQRPPARSARTLPVSTPPPSARSKKVIQWP